VFVVPSVSELELEICESVLEGVWIPLLLFGVFTFEFFLVVLGGFTFFVFFFKWKWRLSVLLMGLQGFRWIN
jgi:hypothetical protein